MPNARRRTSDWRAALLEYRNSDDPNATIRLPEPDEEFQDELFGDQGEWQCHICSVVLTESVDIRILIPCGHTFCAECARDLKRCSLKECRKKVLKSSRAHIQSESLNLEEEAERDERDRIEMHQKLQQIEAKIKECKNAYRLEGQKINNRLEFNRRLLDERQASRRSLDNESDKMKVKINLAKFLFTIDEPSRPFPVLNKGQNCKDYYLLAATSAVRHYRKINKEAEKNVTEEELRLNVAIREKSDLIGLLKEFVQNRDNFDDEDPAVWDEFEEMVNNPNTSFDIDSSDSSQPTSDVNRRFGALIQKTQDGRDSEKASKKAF